MAQFIDEFIRVCDDGFKFAWHEANAGNLSYRLTPEDLDEIKSSFNEKSDWISLDVSLDNLANDYFLCTASGKHFRNVKSFPEESCGIIEMNETGDAYRKCWGFKNNARPTSELPMHLMTHSVKKEEDQRVVYHAHTPNINVMTFVLDLDEFVFTKELWTLSTECLVIFPKGVGVVEWMVPGSFDIALKSKELMAEKDFLIWAHHGAFASGTNFDQVFGLMHTIEKTAEIWVKIHSLKQDLKQRITMKQLYHLAKDFKVDTSYLDKLVKHLPDNN